MKKIAAYLHCDLVIHLDYQLEVKEGGCVSIYYFFAALTWLRLCKDSNIFVISKILKQYF